MRYIFVDLEMSGNYTLEDGSRADCSEITEIGAVALTEDGLSLGERFQTLVRPERPLNERVSRLTGITESDVADAPGFEDAVRAFIDFVGDGEVTVYSWSFSDIDQLVDESQMKGVLCDEVDYLDSVWADFQGEYMDFFGITRSLSLNNAIWMIDSSFDRKSHRALGDAENTAELYLRMKKEGDRLKAESKFSSDTAKTGGTSLGALLGDKLNSFFDNKE